MTTTINGKATDLITFSRDSLATVTDADGKIKWAPHNLLLASEQFDASSWAKSNATVSANTEEAPNGTDTADRLVENNTLASHGLISTLVTVGARHTVGVFARADTRDWAYIRIRDNGDVFRYAYFNLSTGEVGTVETNLTAQILPVGGGWYLCTATVAEAKAGSNTVVVGITTADNTNSHLGNGTGTIHIWGAHLYRSDLGGMQANASAYPYYNPSTPRNLLGYSEAFEQWGKQTAGDTITKDVGIAPNGSLSADLWVADGTSSSHRIETVISIIPTTKTYSFYAKAQTASAFVQLSTAGTSDGWVNFDLLAGTSSDQGTGMTGTITPVGDSWYRCSVHCTIAAATNPRISQVSGLSAARIETAALSSGIYLWGAQLSDSASLDPYVPNFGAAPSAAAYHGPRLDYDPVTLAARGLLVEEARVNLLQRSAEFDTTWSPVNSSVSANSTDPAAIAPDGSFSADFIVPDNTSNQHGINQTITSVSSPFAFSVYAKAGGYDRLTIATSNLGYSVFNLTNGTVSWYNSVGVTSRSITPVGNGWYRCVVIGSTASGVTVGFRVFNADLTSGDPVFTGDETSGIYLWGAQLEENASFATSYIPTAADSVTRNADVASVGTSQFPYSASEGTIVVSGNMIATPGAAQAFAHLGDNNNGTIITANPSSSRFQAYTFSGGNIQAAQTYTAAGTPAASTIYKIASALKASDFAMSVNGNTVATLSSGAMPVGVSKLSIGNQDGGVTLLNGWIRQVTYIPRRLSDAELQARTV